MTSHYFVVPLVLSVSDFCWLCLLACHDPQTQLWLPMPSPDPNFTPWPDPNFTPWYDEVTARMTAQCYFWDCWQIRRDLVIFIFPNIWHRRNLFESRNSTLCCICTQCKFCCCGWKVEVFHHRTPCCVMVQYELYCSILLSYIIKTWGFYTAIGRIDKIDSVPVCPKFHIVRRCFSITQICATP